MLSTAIIWGVIAKIANKMADMSPLINSLHFFQNLQNLLQIHDSWGFSILYVKEDLRKKIWIIYIFFNNSPSDPCNSWSPFGKKCEILGPLHQFYLKHLCTKVNTYWYICKQWMVFWKRTDQQNTALLQDIFKNTVEYQMAFRSQPERNQSREGLFFIMNLKRHFI